MSVNLFLTNDICNEKVYNGLPPSKSKIICKVTWHHYYYFYELGHIVKLNRFGSIGFSIFYWLVCETKIKGLNYLALELSLTELGVVKKVSFYKFGV